MASVSVEAHDLLRRCRAALSAGTGVECGRVDRLHRAAFRLHCVELHDGEIRQRGRGGLWRVLQPVIGRKQKRCTAPIISPDALNEYYATIGETTMERASSLGGCLITATPSVHYCHSFKVQLIDFCRTLATMWPSKFTRIDGIRIHFIQKSCFGLGL